jgi:4a-hydroxytetrahydrobiopterin dehydratase
VTGRVPPHRFSADEIERALASLPGWTLDGDAIIREFRLPDFAAAIAVVVRIGFLAESADHHPDIDIRWRTVTIRLTTHECHGLSQRDFALAAAIDAASGAGANGGQR